MSAVAIKRVPQIHPAPSLHDTQNGLHFVNSGINNFITTLPVKEITAVDDKWDSEHVRLPCSKRSLYPVKKQAGKITGLRQRWKLIVDALFVDEIKTPTGLAEAILKYNSRFKASKNWSFSALLDLLTNDFTSDRRNNFFNNILPFILKMVEETEFLLAKPIPLCRQQSNKTITLNQLQCCCILANSFFCTWSRRNSYKADSEYANFPLINFNAIFSGQPDVCKEKILCLINYFETVSIRMNDNHKFGNITFERRSVMSYEGLDLTDTTLDNNIIPNWKNSSKKFNKVNTNVYKGVSINDFTDSLQCDFANKFLGGGVIGTGCVQEEIMFLERPELMVGMLFNEVMADNEAIIITGCEKYNRIEGYAFSSKYMGPYRYDILHRDSAGRLQEQITAIDALAYDNAGKNLEQFAPNMVERELNKCYAGIYVSKKLSEPFAELPSFTTGKWGCGCFNGNVHLKYLIQMMTCLESGRNYNFCCFDENVDELAEQLKKIYEFLKEFDKSVKDVMKLINNYYLDVKEGRIMYDFYDYLDGMLEDAEDERVMQELEEGK